MEVPKYEVLTANGWLQKPSEINIFTAKINIFTTDTENGFGLYSKAIHNFDVPQIILYETKIVCIIMGASATLATLHFIFLVNLTSEL